MELRQLIQNLPIRVERGDEAAPVDAVVDDSRQAGPGALFVARAGRDADGKRFVEDAVGRGAVAVLADSPVDCGEATLLVGDEPGALGIELARRLHGDPASKLKLIGITGTNGKTTTAYMVRHLLNAADVRCGMIGTIEIDDGSGQAHAAELTTPGAIELTALLGRMVAHGCAACVMEVSSHALDQGRVEPSMFDVAVFTNLTGDHLDYHGTMEEYALAKARLFAGLGQGAVAVINADDPNAELFMEAADAAGARVTTIGLEGEPDLYARVIESKASGMRIRLHGPRDTWETTLPMIGEHNASNLLAAVGAAWHGPKVNAGERPLAVAMCPHVPGRLERVTGGEGFDVFVDYAHTDDALDNVLGAVRPVTRGRLRVLFGCGGDRDATKRPRMASVACELADDVVITSDNPRTEAPDAIIADIVEGVPDEMRDAVLVEPDRAAAIQRIVADAQPGDVVVIAGKGHEDYQIIGQTKHHFDDREQAAAALARRASNPSPSGVGRAGAAADAQRLGQDSTPTASHVPSPSPSRGEGSN